MKIDSYCFHNCKWTSLSIFSSQELIEEKIKNFVTKKIKENDPNNLRDQNLNFIFNPNNKNHFKIFSKHFFRNTSVTKNWISLLLYNKKVLKYWILKWQMLSAVKETVICELKTLYLKENRHFCVYTAVSCLLKIIPILQWNKVTTKITFKSDNFQISEEKR